MNKSILAVIGLVLALLAGFFIFSNRRATAPTGESNLNQSSSSAQIRKDSLRNLLAGGKDLACAVSIPIPEGGSMSGRVYVAGGKTRSDFTVQSAGQEIQSHTIVSGGYSYSWSSLNSQGVKVKADQKAADGSAEGGSANGNAELDQEMQVDCQDWPVDNTLFEVPANIQFVEAGAAPSGTPSSNSAACDSLPSAEAQAACQAALGN